MLDEIKAVLTWKNPDVDCKSDVLFRENGNREQ